MCWVGVSSGERCAAQHLFFFFSSWQLELSVCLLLSDLSYPKLFFKAEALGTPGSLVRLWQGSGRDPAYRRPRGLQVPRKRGRVWKQRPGCLALRFLYSTVHKSAQDLSDIVSLAWVCVQAKI